MRRNCFNISRLNKSLANGFKFFSDETKRIPTLRSAPSFFAKIMDRGSKYLSSEMYASLFRGNGILQREEKEYDSASRNDKSSQASDELKRWSLDQNAAQERGNKYETIHCSLYPRSSRLKSAVLWCLTTIHITQRPLGQRVHVCPLLSARSGKRRYSKFHSDEW